MQYTQETGKSTPDGRKILKLAVSGSKAYYVEGKDKDGNDTLLQYDADKGRVIPDKATLQASFETECNVDYDDPNGKFKNTETHATLNQIDDNHVLGVHEYDHVASNGAVTKRMAIVAWQCGKDAWYPERFGGKITLDSERKEALIDMLTGDSE